MLRHLKNLKNIENNMTTQLEAARIQQTLYKKHAKQSEPTGVWGHAACSMQTESQNCFRNGRCNWKPLSYLQKINFSRFLVPYVQCKEDEHYFKQLIHELEAYGKKTILYDGDEDSVLFPDGFNPRQYGNEIKFSSPLELQQLIIPEIDEVTVDAIFQDFVNEHHARFTAEMQTTNQQLDAMEKTYMQRVQDGSLDVGSRLSILYLLCKTKQSSEVNLGIFTALMNPDFTFFNKLTMIEKLLAKLEHEENTQTQQTPANPSARRVVKTLITTAMMAGIAYLAMQAPNMNGSELNSVVSKMIPDNPTPTTIANATNVMIHNNHIFNLYGNTTSFEEIRQCPSDHTGLGSSVAMIDTSMSNVVSLLKPMPLLKVLQFNTNDYDFEVGEEEEEDVPENEDAEMKGPKYQPDWKNQQQLPKNSLISRRPAANELKITKEHDFTPKEQEYIRRSEIKREAKLKKEARERTKAQADAQSKADIKEQKEAQLSKLLKNDADMTNSFRNNGLRYRSDGIALKTHPESAKLKANAFQAGVRVRHAEWEAQFKPPPKTALETAFGILERLLMYDRSALIHVNPFKKLEEQSGRLAKLDAKYASVKRMFGFYSESELKERAEVKSSIDLAKLDIERFTKEKEQRKHEIKEEIKKVKQYLAVSAQQRGDDDDYFAHGFYAGGRFATEAEVTQGIAKFQAKFPQFTGEEIIELARSGFVYVTIRVNPHREEYVRWNYHGAQPEARESNEAQADAQSKADITEPKETQLSNIQQGSANVKDAATETGKQPQGIKSQQANEKQLQEAARILTKVREADFSYTVDATTTRDASRRFYSSINRQQTRIGQIAMFKERLDAVDADLNAVKAEYAEQASGSWVLTSTHEAKAIIVEAQKQTDAIMYRMHESFDRDVMPDQNEHIEEDRRQFVEELQKSDQARAQFIEKTVSESKDTAVLHSTSQLLPYVQQLAADQNIQTIIMDSHNVSVPAEARLDAVHTLMKAGKLVIVSPKLRTTDRHVLHTDDFVGTFEHVTQCIVKFTQLMPMVPANQVLEAARSNAIEGLTAKVPKPFCLSRSKGGECQLDRFTDESQFFEYPEFVRPGQTEIRSDSMSYSDRGPLDFDTNKRLTYLDNLHRQPTTKSQGKSCTQPKDETDGAKRNSLLSNNKPQQTNQQKLQHAARILTKVRQADASYTKYAFAPKAAGRSFMKDIENQQKRSQQMRYLKQQFTAEDAKLDAIKIKYAEQASGPLFLESTSEAQKIIQSAQESADYSKKHMQDLFDRDLRFVNTPEMIERNRLRFSDALKMSELARAEHVENLVPESKDTSNWHSISDRHVLHTEDFVGTPSDITNKISQFNELMPSLTTDQVLEAARLKLISGLVPKEDSSVNAI